MPNTKQIGFAHVEPPKPIEDENLKAFMDSSDVVIVCFGSIAKFSQIGEEKIKIFLNTFKKFPNINFVWKFEEKIENLPENVKTFKWLNLADALAHPNVKFFISHAGLASAYEAIDREVPMIVFPLCFDHFSNAKMLVHNKIAVELDLNDFTEKDLEKSFLEILNGRFKENIRKLKKIVNDTPKKPLDVAVETIEFAIRNKNFFNVENGEHFCTFVTVLRISITILLILMLKKIFL